MEGLTKKKTQTNKQQHNFIAKSNSGLYALLCWLSRRRETTEEHLLVLFLVEHLADVAPNKDPTQAQLSSKHSAFLDLLGCF